MAVKPTWCGFAVVKVGFIVEGDCDKIMVESTMFRDWLYRECSLELVDPVVDATGNGNLLARNIGTYVELLRRKSVPDKIVVLADLDPENKILCIAERKAVIDSEGIDVILIARTSIESWFLADSVTMGHLTGIPDFEESTPEAHPDAWKRLRLVLFEKTGRGTGPSKPYFAKKVIQHGFDLSRAAAHPACPSAAYAVAQLKALASVRVE